MTARAGEPPTSPRDGLVLAVDGGNSKTDLALVRGSGQVVAFVRGPLGSPHHIGLDGSVSLLDDLLTGAVRIAGMARDDGTIATVARLMLAGLDFPDEERRLHDAVAVRGWAERVAVGNDTFAVLRAGTDRGWGIAVTCGTGINCVGIGPDGRHVRFPSLGSITGDWGGGWDLGVAALGAAARSQDGRGPRTILETSVPAHFALATPLAVAEAVHTRAIPERRLTEVAPLVFAEAERDEVARALLARLTAEVAAFVHATIVRLELDDLIPEVLLGGGLMQAANGRLVRDTAAFLAGLGLEVKVSAVSSPPIVGAALLALDDLGADPTAHARARRELEEATVGYARPPGVSTEDDLLAGTPAPTAPGGHRG